MLLFFLSWIIITFVFISFGDLLICGWNKISKKGDTYSFFDTFWFGLAFVGVLLMIVSLFSPINYCIKLTIVLIPIIYWLIRRKRLGEYIKSIYHKFSGFNIWLKAILFLAFIAILIFSLQPKPIYDFGLYHLQTMMWNQEYSIVPGLGNLHSRFGFNSSFLLLSTLFYNPDQYTPFFPLNSLCVLLFTAWMFLKISRSDNIFRQIILTFITIIILFTFVLILNSTSTDILVNILAIYIFLTCVLNDNIKEKPLLLIVIPLFCMTLKTSIAPIALLPLFLFIYYLRIKEYRILGIACLLSALIVIPWLTRFIILTGYVLYPFASIDIFSFDWKMPIEMVEMESLVTRTWAQAPSQDLDYVMSLSFFEWFIPWFERLPYIEKTLYILTALSPFTILICIRQIENNKFILYSWLAAFVGALLCFISAPTPRFGYAFIVYAGLIPFIAFFSKNITVRYSQIILNVFLVLAMLYFVRSSIKLTLENKENNILLYSLIYQPLYPDYKKEKQEIYFYEYEINGTKFYSTNQMGANHINCYVICVDHCFDQLLPCTPYLNENLELRGKSLQNGFRIKNDK